MFWIFVDKNFARLTRSSPKLIETTYIYIYIQKKC